MSGKEGGSSCKDGTGGENRRVAVSGGENSRVAVSGWESRRVAVSEGESRSVLPQECRGQEGAASRMECREQESSCLVSPESYSRAGRSVRGC